MFESDNYSINTICVKENIGNRITEPTKIYSSNSLFYTENSVISMLVFH